MAELEQFAANAHVTPKPVLPRQPHHQLPALARRASPGLAGRTSSRALVGSWRPSAARIMRSVVRQRGRRAVRRRTSSSWRRTRSSRSRSAAGRPRMMSRSITRRTQGREQGQQHGAASLGPARGAGQAAGRPPTEESVPGWEVSVLQRSGRAVGDHSPVVRVPRPALLTIKFAMPCGSTEYETRR